VLQHPRIKYNSNNRLFIEFTEADNENLDGDISKHGFTPCNACSPNCNS